MSSAVTVAGHGGYPLAVRVFEPPGAARAQVVILHGVVSHSGWLAPIAELVARGGVRVICPDRRGTGLNKEAAGDAPSSEALLGDVFAVVRHFAQPELPLHLAGFCWGANYAIAFAQAHAAEFRSLILIAPGVFSLPEIANRRIEIGENGAATEEPVVPLEYFTNGAQYEEFILPDPLRTRRVSQRFNAVMAELNGKAAPMWARLRLPTLLILASRDRVSDNAKLSRAFGVLRANPKIERIVDAEHGVQFDAPSETAEIVSEWLDRLDE